MQLCFSQSSSLRTITYTRKEAIHQAWNVLVDSLFSAAAVKRLSCHGTPLFSVSGRQRSNTLYFACKVCANKVLLAPIGNPAPRGFSPLDTPLFLTAKRYQNHKSRFGIHAVKNRKSEKSPRGGLKKFRIFVHGNLLRICKFPWRSCGGETPSSNLFRSVDIMICGRAQHREKYDYLSFVMPNGGLLLFLRLCGLFIVAFVYIGKVNVANHEFALSKNPIDGIAHLFCKG